MRTMLILVALALLASGCTDNNTTQSDDNPVDDAPGLNDTAYDVFTGSQVVSGAGTPAVSFSQGEAVVFTVPAGTTLMLAEMKWNDNVQDLNMHLQTGGNLGSTTWDHSNTGGQPGSPDNPQFIEVPNPSEGEWRATAFANGAAANLSVDYAITFFMEETAIPEGYSGF